MERSPARAATIPAMATAHSTAESGEDERVSTSAQPPVKRQRADRSLRSDSAADLSRRDEDARGTPRRDEARHKATLLADEGTGERPGGESHGTRRHSRSLRLLALAADNCHAQNGYSPLAAWHGGLETARASAPLAPDVDGEDTRATPVRSRRRARRAPPALPAAPDSAPLPPPPARTSLFEIFAHRAAAQMARRAPVSRDLFVNR